MSVVCKVFKNTNSSNKLIWDVDGNVDLSTPALAVRDLSRRVRW